MYWFINKALNEYKFIERKRETKKCIYHIMLFYVINIISMSLTFADCTLLSEMIIFSFSNLFY